MEIKNLKLRKMLINYEKFSFLVSIFTFKWQSVLVLSFHCKSYRNWNRINYWLYALRPNNMSWFNFGWRLLHNIFSYWCLTLFSNVLTVLSLPWRSFILVSITISNNILWNLSPSLLGSSLFGSFLTFLSMLSKLFNHNIFMTQ